MLQEVLSTSALRDHKRQRAQDDRDGKPGWSPPSAKRAYAAITHPSLLHFLNIPL